jgi:hypothetical protein
MAVIPETAATNNGSDPLDDLLRESVRIAHLDIEAKRLQAEIEGRQAVLAKVRLEADLSRRALRKQYDGTVAPQSQTKPKPSYVLTPTGRAFLRDKRKTAADCAARFPFNGPFGGFADQPATPDDQDVGC